VVDLFIDNVLYDKNIFYFHATESNFQRV
jgi:hypothetical protein